MNLHCKPSQKEDFTEEEDWLTELWVCLIFDGLKFFAVVLRYLIPDLVSVILLLFYV